MKILEKIGLSQNEANIYKGLLQLGGEGVREISRITDIKRPTVYFCLENLIKLELVTENIQKGGKTYTAVEPEKLINLVRVEKAEVEAKEKNLLTAIPKLKKLAHNPEASADVRVYEGFNSIWKLSEELLRQHKDFLFIYSGKSVLGHISPEELLKKFTKKRRQYGGSKVYAISDSNPISDKKLREGDTEFREIRVIKKHINFNSIFCLCGNKIILISLPGQPKAVIIENQPIAEILDFLFWSLWKSVR